MTWLRSAFASESKHHERRPITTKADLTEEIARVVELSKREATIVLDVFLDGMVRALRRGDRIELRGFGSFNTHARRSRIGRNPLTGIRVDVPAKRVAHFKPSRELTALVNGSKGQSTGSSTSEVPAAH